MSSYYVCGLYCIIGNVEHNPWFCCSFIFVKPPIFCEDLISAFFKIIFVCRHQFQLRCNKYNTQLYFWQTLFSKSTFSLGDVPPKTPDFFKIEKMSFQPFLRKSQNLKKSLNTKSAKISFLKKTLFKLFTQI